jgi:hypothetical protein
MTLQHKLVLLVTHIVNFVLDLLQQNVLNVKPQKALSFIKPLV